MKKEIIKKIYLAGPLFSRGEIRDRIEDEKKLQLSAKTFNESNKENLKITFDIFNPINFNEEIDKKNIKLERDTIFRKDYYEMSKSDIVIADIDNMDVGTILELGIFMG